MNMFTSNFWWSVLSGIIGNLFFTILVIWLIQKIRYYCKLKRKFHNAKFISYWKRFPEEEVHIIACTVYANRLFINGCRVGSSDVFSGEVIINPINLRTGEGFHSHSKSDGFAFVKIIIADDRTLLVESSYVGAKKDERSGRTKGFDVPQAFIWKKQ